MSQRRVASVEFALKKKRTRREKFLADMERVVPWSRLIAVIEPVYRWQRSRGPSADGCFDDAQDVPAAALVEPGR